MTFPDLTAELKAKLPELKGRLSANVPLADITWFRVGGPAQVLFAPADEADLAYFLKGLPLELPVMLVGLGSNLLVRDGGLPGVVVRLGRGFSAVNAEPGHRVRAGTAVPDVKVARAAAEAGIAGLAFYRGIPGSIGGALRMNAGAHGCETKDVLIEARAVDRRGNVHALSLADMGFTYRHSAVPDDFILTEALFQGAPGDQAAILRQMDEVADYREKNQPIRERTGGSTFRKSSRSERLEADRRGRLPRIARGRSQGVGHALQLSHQRGQCHGRGHRASRRDRAGARQGALRHPAAVGDHPLGRAASRLPDR